MRFLSELWDQTKGNLKYDVLKWLALFVVTASASILVAFTRRWAGHSVSTLEIILIPTLVSALICAVPLAMSFRSRVSVHIEASTGPGAVQYLIIRNTGNTATFSVFCDLVGHTNDPNRLTTGEFRLGWDEGGIAAKRLLRGESARLVIASFKTVLDRTDSRAALFQMNLLEVSQGFSKERASFRWYREPNELLPSFDCVLRIVSDSAKREKRVNFTVGPESHHGPLAISIK